MSIGEKLLLAASQIALLMVVGFILNQYNPWLWLIPAPMIVLWLLTIISWFEAPSKNIYLGP